MQPSLNAEPATAALRAPLLRRRLACLVYESVLLFAVIFFAGLVYSVLTGQRNAMSGRIGLSWVAFVLAPGLYFTWYWSQTGQTLPMQTWRIQVQTAAGERLSRLRAALRFAACWAWVLPPLVLAWALGWHRQAGLLTLAVSVWILAYALSSRLNATRQFWHDIACGTRLVDTRGPAST